MMNFKKKIILASKIYQFIIEMKLFRAFYVHNAVNTILNVFKI